MQLLFSVSLATVQHLEAPGVKRWEGCGIQMLMWVLCGVTSAPISGASQAQKVAHTHAHTCPSDCSFLMWCQAPKQRASGTVT